ncbi:MAG: type II toxin-antitoxin system mRNA interferase toxin, RelE/StbE family [bacterium]
MEIFYKPSFVRDFKNLSAEVRAEARAKIELFRQEQNHHQLRVHKLKGKLQSFYSFSITHEHRVVFSREKDGAVVFLAIGTHDIYK